MSAVRKERSIRRILHSNVPLVENDELRPPEWHLWAFGAVLLVLAIILLSGCASASQIPTEKAVKAIIGEAEGNYREMVAVGCALRNRGSFSGVYGLHSYRVTHHKYSQHTYNMAVKAWAESARADITNGATGWGNEADVAKFRHSAWFPSVYFTAHIGRQYFYNTDG